LIVHILESAGYSVRVAPAAAPALEILLDDPSVGLMITDVMLPHMSGLELAREAVATRPGLRVLFMSGFDAPVDAGIDFIQKPFSPDALLAKVKEMLG
jgi:DNA-binding response OmpR family regulator